MSRKSNTGVLVALGLGLVAFNFLRQGQTLSQVLATGRLANFRPLRLRGTTLECEAQVAFTNTHPTRSTTIDSLGLTVKSESGVQLFTVLQPMSQVIAAGSTSLVVLPVALNLLPIFIQAIDYTGLPALLRSFTSLGAVMSWITQRAGLRNCVVEGNAQVQGIVVPIRAVVQLGLFTPPPVKK